MLRISAEICLWIEVSYSVLQFLFSLCFWLFPYTTRPWFDQSAGDPPTNSHSSRIRTDVCTPGRNFSSASTPPCLAIYDLDLVLAFIVVCFLDGALQFMYFFVTAKGFGCLCWFFTCAIIQSCLRVPFWNFSPFHARFVFITVAVFVWRWVSGVQGGNSMHRRRLRLALRQRRRLRLRRCRRFSLSSTRLRRSMAFRPAWSRVCLTESYSFSRFCFYIRLLYPTTTVLIASLFCSL